MTCPDEAWGFCLTEIKSEAIGESPVMRVMHAEAIQDVISQDSGG